MKGYVIAGLLATSLIPTNANAQDRKTYEKSSVYEQRIIILPRPQPTYNLQIRQRPEGILTSETKNGRTTTQNVTRNFNEYLRARQAQIDRQIQELRAKGYIK